MKIFILNETDSWNTSPEIIAICASKETAVELAQSFAKNKQQVPLSQYELESLDIWNQTQGREFNFDIRTAAMNTFVE